MNRLARINRLAMMNRLAVHARTLDLKRRFAEADELTRRLLRLAQYPMNQNMDTTMDQKMWKLDDGDGGDKAFDQNDRNRLEFPEISGQQQYMALPEDASDKDSRSPSSMNGGDPAPGIASKVHYPNEVGLDLTNGGDLDDNLFDKVHDPDSSFSKYIPN